MAAVFISQRLEFHVNIHGLLDQIFKDPPTVISRYKHSSGKTYLAAYNSKVLSPLKEITNTSIKNNMGKEKEGREKRNSIIVTT